MVFWDHLDELRASLLKIIVATIVFGLIAFFFKEVLFDIVLAPKNDTFVTYKLFKVLSSLFAQEDLQDGFSVKLINTGLAEQFMIHMKVAIYAGFLIASPYIIYVLFKFVSPALYTNEKKYAFRVITSGYLMFLSGILLSYF